MRKRGKQSNPKKKMILDFYQKYEQTNELMKNKWNGIKTN